MNHTQTLTGQLRLYSGGQHDNADAILREIFPRLRQIAVRKLSGERAYVPITPTDLVGETWLTNLRSSKWSIENRDHFFGIVGQAMEHVLTDMARKRLAQRRGSGARHLSLEDLTSRQQPTAADAEQVISIGLLLAKLDKLDAKAAFVVRLHYIVGFTLEEIARETGLSLRQVRHRWHKGKGWLATQLVSSRSSRPS